jgi:hypothetical protein
MDFPKVLKLLFQAFSGQNATEKNGPLNVVSGPGLLHLQAVSRSARL